MVVSTSQENKRPRGPARREALLEAVLAIVAEVGAEAVTHRRVAERAGLPLASTTYWFDSKEDLLTAALELAAERDVAPTDAEIDFIIAELNRYLERPAARKDVLAAFAGLRPLVSGKAVTTAKLSREHLVEVSKTGVVTIAGGKWTTYRKMAADTVDAAARTGGLTQAPSRTARLPLHGSPGAGIQPSDLGYAAYGADREELLALERADPALAVRLDPRLPYTRAQVVFAARCELARTIDDVLARRTRALFLDADAARAAAPEVAALLAAELGRDAAWQHNQLAAFEKLLATAR